MQTVLVILLFITLILISYLVFLLIKIKQQKTQQNKFDQLMELGREKKDQQRLESIDTISLAVIQKQCDLVEGVIRVKKLMELDERFRDWEEAGPILEFYELIKDFAYLEDYQKLSKQEKFKQDNQRFKLAQEHFEVVTAAFTELRTLIKSFKSIS